MKLLRDVLQYRMHSHMVEKDTNRIWNSEGNLMLDGWLCEHNNVCVCVCVCVYIYIYVIRWYILFFMCIVSLF